jgi:hypothetical protein
MSATTTYVIRGPQNRGPQSRYVTITGDALDERLRLAPSYRTRSVRDSPIGPIRSLEHDGTHHANVLQAGLGGSDERIRRADGTGSVGWNFYLTIGRDAVRDRIRRLRPADVERLAELDDRIDELRRELVEVRNQRTKAVANAWRYGAGVNPDRLRETAQTNTR